MQPTLRGWPPEEFDAYIGHVHYSNSLLDLIGNTPLVRLNATLDLPEGGPLVLAKVEYLNPGGSVKDRIATRMIDAAEASGELQPGGTIVEPTSGNTGIGLAFVAASRGYRLILVMPETMSIERRKILTHLGAELDLTPGPGGMPTAVARAEELARTLPDAVIPGQFDNQANPLVHEQTTAEEIFNDTGGKVDALVIGIGTGGTLTGCGRNLKKRIPGLKLYAVEPSTSAVLSGQQRGPHKIQGLGAGFIPSVLQCDLIDEVVTVPSEMAFETSRMLARVEGIPGGISTGANVAAALTVAQKPEMAGKTIVTFAPSSAERYMSSELFLDPQAKA